jgi:hypothetical protein
MMGRTTDVDNIEIMGEKPRVSLEDIGKLTVSGFSP